MASTVPLPRIFFLICSTFILSISHSANVPVNDGFALRLIHRDSPHSPYYNHSMTTYDRRLAAVHRSLSRLKHLHSRANGRPEFSPKLIPDGTEYVVNVYVGTPPTQVYAFIDTGSDFVWIKGLPFFDHTKSFSYTNLSCDSELCNDLGSSKTCKGRDPCTYKYTYADKATTSGVLSKDKFTFEAPDRSLVDAGFVQFGYSSSSSVAFTGKQDGCVGLSRSPLSLIEQLGIKKFSHCMTIPAGDIAPGSLMYFGSRAVVYGSQTPILENEEGIYNVNLESIDIGDEKFPNTQEIMVDSGTSFTLLAPEVFQPMLDKMRELVQDLPSVHGMTELCFKGSSEEVWALPNVTFHFAGADIELRKESTFLETENDVWCLALLRSPVEDLSIFGNIQMRDFWIGYDLERKVISFQSATCAEF